MCPEMLNWPDRLAGISEDASRILKEKVLDHFLPSFLSLKMIISRLEILVHLSAGVILSSRNRLRSSLTFDDFFNDFYN